MNATAKYLYLNDADLDQPVFEGYPVENVVRLQAIRDRYDPGMVFTNLMPLRILWFRGSSLRDNQWLPHDISLMGIAY